MAAQQVEIKGLDRLVKAMKKYPKISEPILQRAIDATGAVFAKNTLKDDPVPWRTGMLTQTFIFSTKPQLPPLQATWKPTRGYAPFVEFGTSKMRARPYMGKILEKSRREIDTLFITAGDQITRAIAKG